VPERLPTTPKSDRFRAILPLAQRPSREATLAADPRCWIQRRTCYTTVATRPRH